MASACQDAAVTLSSTKENATVPAKGSDGGSVGEQPNVKDPSSTANAEHASSHAMQQSWPATSHGTLSRHPSPANIQQKKGWAIHERIEPGSDVQQYHPRETSEMDKSHDRKMQGPIVGSTSTPYQLSDDATAMSASAEARYPFDTVGWKIPNQVHRASTLNIRPGSFFDDCLDLTASIRYGVEEYVLKVAAFDSKLRLDGYTDARLQPLLETIVGTSSLLPADIPANVLLVPSLDVSSMRTSSRDIWISIRW